MTTISVDDVTYSGSDLEGAVQNEMPAQRTFSHFRLDAFVDTTDLRDPYLMTADLADVRNDWKIGRKWKGTNHVSFVLWAVPETDDVEFDPEEDDQFYRKNETFLGEVNLNGQASPPADLGLNGDLQLNFGPSTSSANTIEFARQDFANATDDGLDWVDKAIVETVAFKLSSQRDQAGALHEPLGPDGYPDDAVDFVGQGWHGYCAIASLLFNYAVHFPRRAVELVRSFYQPITHVEGEHGYLTYSNTFPRNTYYLFNAYIYERSNNDRTKEKAFLDVISRSLRENLEAVRPYHESVSEDRDSGDGINSVESEAMMIELMPVVGTHTTRHSSTDDPGLRMLRRGKGAILDGDANTLSIDASLVRVYDGNEQDEDDHKLSPDPSVDHAITLLDADIPRLSENAGRLDDTIEVVYHDPWGGEAKSDDIPKEDIDEYIINVTVGNL